MVFSFSTRSCWSGVSVGIEPIMRLQANGAMQFERTWDFAMSRAIDFDSPTMPSLAAEELAWPRLPTRPEGEVMCT